MIQIGNITKTSVENTLRKIKMVIFGKSDVKTPYQVAPFGDDSNPPANVKGVYCKSANDLEPVCLGVFNVSNIAGTGEKRIYSTDSNGTVKSDIILKNDGTIEIISGSSNHAVQFEALKSGLENQDNDINTELSKIKTTLDAVVSAFNALGVTIPPYVKADVNTSIDSSKLNNIKVP